MDLQRLSHYSISTLTCQAIFRSDEQRQLEDLIRISDSNISNLENNLTVAGVADRISSSNTFWEIWSIALPMAA